MKPYEDRYWTSADGLRLHYRHYDGPVDRPPILCLPGLTRNARDFAGVAGWLAGEWRVLAVSFRGRGDSDYADDSMTYAPNSYVQDVQALLRAIGCERFVAFGTSLGGIVTMLLADAMPGQVAGALLNDVGPELDPAGLARIGGYVGRASSWPTWPDAARALAGMNADVYPLYGQEQWLDMAQRLCRQTRAGAIELDYDMRIAEPFRRPATEVAPDMWRVLAAGLRDVPTLIVRGARSDLLAASVADRMVETLGRAELVTVPDEGHAPTLDEPEAVAGIDRLLARVSGTGAGA